MATPSRTHSTLLRVALPVLLLIGTVVLGCHTSAKAPAHVFSDATAAARTLPVRLRNSAEHDAVRREFGEPYVLEFSDLPGGGALHYYGGRHSSDRDDPQVADIRERWESFEPTVALCEGRQRRHIFGILVEPFAGLPEATLVHKLSRRDDVRLVSLEPDYDAEVAMLLRSFEPEDVALYFFLRVYASESGGTPDESLARDLLTKRTDVDGLRDSLTDLEAVDARWAELYPAAADWRTVNHELREGRLGAISTASRATRGEHMARVLTDLTLAGERVFAVVGSGHVIRQEWALRSWLGREPAPDQPE